MRAILVLLILTAASPAAGQAPAAAAAAQDAAARTPQSLQGLAVRGQGGVVLGHVEQVVPGPDGRPAQVLVRPRGLRAAGPRSLAFGAVRVADGVVRTPLTKAEFDAMPAVAPR